MVSPLHVESPTLAPGETGVLPPDIPDEISAREAAVLLNVSVPFVARLVEEGSLSSRKVNGEDRFPRAAVLGFRERDDRKRKGIAAELTALSQGMGLYD